MTSVTLIAVAEADLPRLQCVLEASPGYSMRIMGHPPGPAEAQSTVTALPPGKSYEDKLVFGVLQGDEWIGCVDLIRGYPDDSTAMLGLLLLREDRQGRGLGRAAYDAVEREVRSWAGISRIRIGIVGTNAEVVPFWERMGYRDTGIRKPYRYDKLVSEHRVFEKELAR